MDLKTRVDVAAGRQPADLVLKNGRIVNVASCEIHEGDVAIAGEHIAGIGEYEGREIVDLKGQYICPGFLDGHVHIESSMLSVPEFAKIVAARGTSAVIADPHEIANVLGAEGIRYMLSSSKYCPIHVYMMVSSSVPASRFESSGADLSALDIEPLLADRWVLGVGGDDGLHRRRRRRHGLHGEAGGRQGTRHRRTRAGTQWAGPMRLCCGRHRQRPRVHDARRGQRKAAAGHAHHDPRGQPGARSRRPPAAGKPGNTRSLHVCH